MKISKILLLLLTGVFVLSCSKKSSNADDDDDLPTSVDKAANLLATGDSANDILSNNNFDSILIEIAYVTGFRPTSASMTLFTDYLRQYTFKEDIDFIYTELDSPVEDDLTLQEIANLETNNRTAYNFGSTLAIFIYFADAPAEGDDLEGGLVTLGAVYRNTSMVIHEATIRELASRNFSISNTDIESATLNHEFGHLFGLVNLGTPMINDHESITDNTGDRHCNQQGCLMRSELQFGVSSAKTAETLARKRYEDGIDSSCALSGNAVLNLLKSSTTAKAAIGLDPECILDIRANGGR